MQKKMCKNGTFIGRQIEPETGISTRGRALLCFDISGGDRLVGTDATNGSISQGETLSGLRIDACSSH